MLSGRAAQSLLAFDVPGAQVSLVGAGGAAAAGVPPPHAGFVSQAGLVSFGAQSLSGQLKVAVFGVSHLMTGGQGQAGLGGAGQLVGLGVLQPPGKSEHFSMSLGRTP
jgi:hypothetical protein